MRPRSLRKVVAAAVTLAAVLASSAPPASADEGVVDGAAFAVDTVGSGGEFLFNVPQAAALCDEDPVPPTVEMTYSEPGDTEITWVSFPDIYFFHSGLSEHMAIRIALYEGLPEENTGEIALNPDTIFQEVILTAELYEVGDLDPEDPCPALEEVVCEGIFFVFSDLDPILAEPFVGNWSSSTNTAWNMTGVADVYLVGSCSAPWAGWLDSGASVTVTNMEIDLP